jgi:nonribosomal peptide synthetase DhbF
MRLIARVRQETGKTLPLRALFEFPAPAGLATQLAEGIAKTYNPLIPLRKSGKFLPIFCIHGGGGMGGVYANLSMALGKDYPVYGVQAKGLEDGEEMHKSINEMANEYSDAIQKIEPNGPYYLLGWSLGGTIAHEIACQLEKKGKVVKLLMLLDTQTNYDPNDPMHKKTTNEMIEKLAKDYGIEISTSAKKQGSHLEIIRDILVSQELLPKDTPLDWVERAFKQLEAVPALTKNHQIKKCKADILFIQAAREVRDSELENYHWEKYTEGNVSNFQIDSLHNTMMQISAAKNIAVTIKQFI